MTLCVLLLSADVLSEDCILKWYKDGHSPKGQSVFLEQLKKMVEWLQCAEEGKDLRSTVVEDTLISLAYWTEFGNGQDC